MVNSYPHLLDPFTIFRVFNSIIINFLILLEVKLTNIFILFTFEIGKMRETKIEQNIFKQAYDSWVENVKY